MRFLKNYLKTQSKIGKNKDYLDREIDIGILLEEENIVYGDLKIYIIDYYLDGIEEVLDKLSSVNNERSE